MWKAIKEFISPPNTPVVSEKTNKVVPKPESDAKLKAALRGKTQRSRMDDLIKNSGG